MLKKILVFTILFLCTLSGHAQDSYTLKSGISITDRVPKAFFGTWRVSAELLFSTNEQVFKQSSVDLWNLSREGDVITLENPFSGAEASIILDEVEGDLIKFKKRGDYDSKKLTDIVQLRLGKSTFSGRNTIILETLSGIDKSVIKTDKATYKLSGEKISGDSVK